MSDRTFFIGITVTLACFVPFCIAAIVAFAKEREWFPCGLAVLGTAWVIFGVIALATNL